MRRSSVMGEAVILAALRTPVGKAPGGSLKDTRPDELAALVIGELLRRNPQVKAEEIEDVILGCAFPEAQQGLNVARIALLRAGLPYTIAGQTVNRFCASGLEAIAIAADRIRSGEAEVIIAGGVESMSQIPMGGWKPSPNPYLAENCPDVYLGMGLTAEEIAKRFSIGRGEQDEFALRSHQRAMDAITSGRFEGETVPIKTRIRTDNGQEEVVLKRDEGVRFDTSMEALSKLRPSFHAKGTVTAGNSSQTSDGAAAVIVSSEGKGRELGITPMGTFKGYAVVGVPPDIMGVGPIYAIRKILKIFDCSLDDIGLIELNEAFAAQALYCIRELQLDAEKVNVNGGAIALGHPLGCTGAKLTTTLLYEMKRRDVKAGLVSMCIGGGMGAAAIMER